MQTCVGDADVPCVEKIAGGGGAFLRLDDLIGERLNCGGWNVRGIAAVGAEFGDEVAVVVLRDNRGHTRNLVRGCKSWV